MCTLRCILSTDFDSFAVIRSVWGVDISGLPYGKSPKENLLPGRSIFMANTQLLLSVGLNRETESTRLGYNFFASWLSNYSTWFLTLFIDLVNDMREETPASWDYLYNQWSHSSSSKIKYQQHEATQPMSTKLVNRKVMVELMVPYLQTK